MDIKGKAEKLVVFELLGQAGLVHSKPSLDQISSQDPLEDSASYMGRRLALLQRCTPQFFVSFFFQTQKNSQYIHICISFLKSTCCWCPLALIWYHLNFGTPSVFTQNTLLCQIQCAPQKCATCPSCGKKNLQRIHNNFEDTSSIEEAWP